MQDLVGAGRCKKKEKINRFYLQDMPMNDRPTRILHHFLPVLQLWTLAIITKGNFANGVRSSDSVIITDGQFQSYALGGEIHLNNTTKDEPQNVKYEPQNMLSVTSRILAREAKLWKY